jgi:hypothetical protein
MSQAGKTSEKLRPAAVFTIPDITSELRDDGVDLEQMTAPTVVSRVRNKTLSRSAKSVVLVGVFAFYALIGMLAAKAIVWLYDDSETLAEELASESELPRQDLRRQKVEPVKNGRTDQETALPTRQQVAAYDPVISDPLRGWIRDQSTPKDRSMVKSPTILSHQDQSSQTPSNNGGTGELIQQATRTALQSEPSRPRYPSFTR